ncbi:uncharacterized protein LOC131857805 [Cryptomeria japonica]|uniref:uncharacterized protein LOC131857805 n=1 Tax=Cryptomeria japonica TaxID=3369 RepID=UPI0027D9F291|nr:uncharacterized protein LOC131857805 [Cryptomeria japonica]
MDLHNLALGAKLAWRMYEQPQKTWCKIMTAKYLDSNDADRIFTVANSINGSPIWKFIWESRNIIIEHLTWKIGNDGKAKFWRDSWNGDISLAEEIDDPVWINEVEALVGPFVTDYILEGQKEAEWIEWKIKQSTECGLAFGIVLAQNGTAQGRGIPLDIIEWSYTNRGKVRSQSLKGFLLAWPTYYKKSKWSIMWVVSLAMLAWYIWKERNRRVFNEEALSFELLIPKIKVAIEEVINIKLVGRKYCTYSSRDKEMERSWNLTKNTSYKFVDKKQNRGSIVWTPPSAGSLKVNFDGASCDNPGKSGYGAIIRDEFGNFVGANFGPLGVTTNNMAEIVGLLARLEWSVGQGFRSLEVEGDSQIVLNGIIK